MATDHALFSGRNEGAIRGINCGCTSKRSTLPKGQIFHMAGQTTGGWQIVAVHDFKESWERFNEGTLLPQMQKRDSRRVRRSSELSESVYNLQK